MHHQVNKTETERECVCNIRLSVSELYSLTLMYMLHHISALLPSSTVDELKRKHKKAPRSEIVHPDLFCTIPHMLFVNILAYIHIYIYVVRNVFETNKTIYICISTIDILL